MNKVELVELAEMVKAATGADRELDRWLHLLVVNDGRRGHFKSNETWVRAAREQRWNTPHITRSVDTTVGIVERKLPGWAWNVGNVGPDDCPSACLTNPDNYDDITGSGATPALALLAALLSAIAERTE